MAAGSLDKASGLARGVERHDSSGTWSYTHRNDRYVVNQSFIENFSDYKSAREAIKKRKLGSSARYLFMTFGSNQSNFTDNDDISLLWFTPMTKETPNPKLLHQLVGILVDDISSEAVPKGKYIWADVQAVDHVDVWSPGSDAAIQMNAATRKEMHEIYGRPPPLTTAQQLHHYHLTRMATLERTGCFNSLNFSLNISCLNKKMSCGSTWMYLIYLASCMRWGWRV